MELTGYDHYIVTSQSPRYIAWELYRSVLSQWPAMIVLNETDEIEPFKGKTSGLKLFPESQGELYFCRDREMNLHWEEYGYSLMPDGEGPFAFRYIKKMNYRFSFRMIDDFTALENSGINGCPESLINAIGLDFYDLTLTTPGYPEENEFSKSLLEFIQKLCHASPTGDNEVS